MIHKPFFLVLALSLLSQIGVAQNDPMSDQERLNLNVHVPDDSVLFNQKLPGGQASSIRKLLEDQLTKIVTRSGFTGSGNSPKFMIFPRVDISNIAISPTPPSQTLAEVSIGLYIADFEDKKVFSSRSVDLQGAGNNAQQAVSNAIRNLKPTDDLRAFLSEGKRRILQYYNDQCDFVMNEANMLAETRNFKKAFSTLLQIPQACKECYTRAQQKIPEYYTLYYNQKCYEDLQKAKVNWAAKKKELEKTSTIEMTMAKEKKTDEPLDRPDDSKKEGSGTVEAGQRITMTDQEVYKALSYLSNIFPDAPCYQEAQQLLQEIKQQVSEDKYFEERQLHNDAKELEKLKIEKSAELAKEFAKENQEYWRSKQNQASLNIIGL